MRNLRRVLRILQAWPGTYPQTQRKLLRRYRYTYQMSTLPIGVGSIVHGRCMPIYGSVSGCVSTDATWVVDVSRANPRVLSRHACFSVNPFFSREFNCKVTLWQPANTAVLVELLIDPIKD